MSLVVQVHGPGNKRSVVGRGPRVSREVHVTRMFLLSRVSQRCNQMKGLVRALRILSMRSRHLSNAFLMSRETVVGDGILVPGRPAFMRTPNSRSLTILKGRWFSAHHFAIWALQNMFNERIRDEQINTSTGFPPSYGHDGRQRQPAGRDERMLQKSSHHELQIWCRSQQLQRHQNRSISWRESSGLRLPHDLWSQGTSERHHFPCIFWQHIGNNGTCGHLHIQCRPWT